MAKKGLLIVFEGMDGSGKATQVNLLMKYFDKLNLKEASKKDAKVPFPYTMYDFPRYYDNFWGAMVGRMMAKEFGTEINPYLRSPFYLLDQSDACKTIRKEIEEGKNIICNRYMTSSMIFQPALIKDPIEKKAYLDWLEDASYNHLGIIKPDIVFCLYMDANTSHELIGKKGDRKYTKGKTHDLNEENIQLQTNVGKEILNLCNERSNWKLINCMEGGKLKSPEQINKEVISKLPF